MHKKILGLIALATCLAFFSLSASAAIKGTIKELHPPGNGTQHGVGTIIAIDGTKYIFQTPQDNNRTIIEVGTEISFDLDATGRISNVSTVKVDSNPHEMNKAELIDAMASGASLSKADAKKALDGFVSNVTGSLKKGNSVQLIGLGTFSVSDRQTVAFDVDRPLAEAVYPLFIENFWGDVNQINANDLRHRHRGHVTVLKAAGTDNTSSNSKFEFVLNPDRVEFTSREYFAIQSHFAEEFSYILSKVDPSQMLSADREFYRQYLSEEFENFAFARAINNAQGLFEKSSAVNFQSALDTLYKQAVSMEAGFLDPNGDSLRTFVRIVARQTKLSERKVNNAYKAMVLAITSALKKGDRVSLIGFGSWSISNRAARTGRNPQTGATIQIKAKKVAKFKAGKALADKVN